MELVFGRMVVCSGSSMRTPRMALPSTSAANAAWSLERLVEAWRVIL